MGDQPAVEERGGELVGGGFAPPLLGLAVAAAATRFTAVGPVSGKRRGTGVQVTYASKYGATREIAEAVAGTLRDRGSVVDVLPCRQVDHASGYDAVVLGTALCLGSPINDAETFLERNRQALVSRPVAVFASGPIGPVDDTARQQLRHALEQHPWLTPTATAVFGGRFDPAPLRGEDRLLTALPASPLHGLGARDDQDWTAIHEWADDLVPTLAYVVAVAAQILLPLGPGRWQRADHRARAATRKRRRGAPVDAESRAALAVWAFLLIQPAPT